MKEFEAWVNTQIMINDMALKESQKVYEEDQDERAKDAMIRYESRLDAYQFLLGKFENFKAGKGFHDLPEGLFGERNLLMFRHQKGGWDKSPSLSNCLWIVEQDAVVEWALLR